MLMIFKLGSCVQLYSLAKTPQLPPPPRIWAHIRGRYWSAKIDDFSAVEEIGRKVSENKYRKEMCLSTE